MPGAFARCSGGACGGPDDCHLTAPQPSRVTASQALADRPSLLLEGLVSGLRGPGVEACATREPERSPTKVTFSGCRYTLSEQETNFGPADSKSGRPPCRKTRQARTASCSGVLL